jgi:hypothetical protein
MNGLPGLSLFRSKILKIALPENLFPKNTKIVGS